MKSLYELGNQYQDLISMEIDTEEDANAFTELMMSLDGEIRDKLENCALAVLSIKWSAIAAREEADRLEKRARSAENKAARLQEYMREQMEATETGPVKTPRVSVWIQNNPPSVVIDDPASVPSDCMVIPEPYPNKREIAERLKSGKVGYAHLEQTKGLRIR